MKYDFSAIESKWQQKWDEAGIFRASDDHTKPKFYGLVEFPPPRGSGPPAGPTQASSGL